MTFKAGNREFKIHSIYGSSWLKYDVVFLQEKIDGEWKDHKFVDVNKILPYLTNEK